MGGCEGDRWEGVRGGSVGGCERVTGGIEDVREGQVGGCERGTGGRVYMYVCDCVRWEGQ